MNYWLGGRLHVSWLIAIAGVALFLGVVCAQIVPAGIFASISWLLTGIALIIWSSIKQRRWIVLCAVIGGLLIGLWRGNIERVSMEGYDPLYDNVLILSGVVSDDVDVDTRGNTVLRIKNIIIENRHLSGTAWIALAGKLDGIERSDRVTVTGTLQRGFGTFVGAMYRAEIRKIERPEPGDIALHVRDWFAGAVRQAIPDPESSLGIGYLVGQRRDLPEELDKALKIAGLTHIVVASGYNLTILVRLARRLMVRVSKYLATLVSGGLIASFIAVTGTSPSMARAGLVTGLSLAAWYYGRKFHPLVLLSIVAAMTVFVNPYYAWGDVGWQLSFAAFAGVMVFAPLLQAFYFSEKKPGILRQILGETIAATILTAPILLYSFGQISNVAIAANLLILPLVPLAMLLTFIAGIGALVAPFAAAIVGFPAHLLLSYMTQTAQFMASIPWAVAEIEIQTGHVFLMYVALAAFSLYMWRKTRFDLRDSNIVE